MVLWGALRDDVLPFFNYMKNVICSIGWRRETLVDRVGMRGQHSYLIKGMAACNYNRLFPVTEMAPETRCFWEGMWHRRFIHGGLRLEGW